MAVANVKTACYQQALHPRCRMRLGLIVSLIVLGVLAMVGAAGYLIDKSAERHDRKQDH